MRRELVVMLLAAACSSRLGELSPSGPVGPPLVDAGSTPSGVGRSTKASVRFKGPERLAADYAAALQLPQDALCKELGQYACTTFVHTLALGGVDPYGNGIYEPPARSTPTSPIAVERVALSACVARVTGDLELPAAGVVFRNVAIDGSTGRLVEPEGTAVHDAIVQLYRRAVMRDPSVEELARHVRLARDIEATSTTTAAADWMKASCLAVLTSTEALFY